MASVTEKIHHSCAGDQRNVGLLKCPDNLVVSFLDSSFWDAKPVFDCHRLIHSHGNCVWTTPEELTGSCSVLPSTWRHWHAERSSVSILEDTHYPSGHSPGQLAPGGWTRQPPEVPSNLSHLRFGEAVQSCWAHKEVKHALIKNIARS